MRTKAQARTRIRQFLVDPNSSVWTDDAIDYHIIESYGSLTMQARVIYTRSSIGDVDGTALYSMPATFQQIIRCTWDNFTIPQMTEAELFKADKLFETIEGDVMAYSVDDITGQLRKWKVPSTTDATKFQIEFFARGTELSADATEFDIPIWMVDILEYRCVGKLLAQEGDGQDFEGATWWLQRWEEGLNTIRTKQQKLVKNTASIMGGLAMSATRPAGPRYPHHYSGPA